MNEQVKQFWKPVPLSQLKAAGEGMEWIWEGVLARSRISLLTAQAKAGKTTLLSLLIREMGRGGCLLGCPVSPGTVIVVTEENSQDWMLRRDNLGLGDHCETICLPFISKPKPSQWLDLLREGYLDIQDRKPDLIVFDTLSHLWPVEDENDNGQMQAALMPLRGMSELGPAILAVHHAGATGLRSRGASELEGFADQLAHLELTTPTDPSCRNRRLTVRGRLTTSPERLEVSLNQQGEDYQVLNGSLKPIRSAVWAMLSTLLPAEPGFTVRELRGAWPDQRNVPSEDTIWKTLTRYGNKAGARQTEDKPARWWMNN